MLPSHEALLLDFLPRKCPHIHTSLPTPMTHSPFLCSCPAPMGPVNTVPLHLQRTEEIATLRENMLSLWSEEGPWPLTLGSKRVFMSLVRQRFFIKDIALGELVSVNSWGVYQAVRWAAESLGLLRVAAQPQGVALWMSCVSGQVASVEDSPPELGGPAKTRSNLSDDPLEACTQDHVSDPAPEIKSPVLVPVGARVSCCLMERLFHSS